MLNDRLSCNDPHKQAAVIHHRNKVMIENALQQILYGGADFYRMIPILSQNILYLFLIQMFQVTFVVTKNPPQKISIIDGSYLSLIHI